MRRVRLPGDYDEIAGWYAARGREAPPIHALPTNGVIVPGVAALFLFATDSSVCLLENAISNPAAPLRERSRAVTRMAEALAEEAHVLGFRTIVFTTRDPGIARRARALGYAPVGTYVMMSRAASATEYAKPATSQHAGEV